MIRMHIKTMK